jgi:DNA-binding NarL/FixJ family response regulator
VDVQEQRERDRRQPGVQSVLVVEDDDACRELVAESLRHAGFACIDASSAEEALALLSVEAPAAAVVDVCLPRVSGYELCRLLLERSPPVRVLFVSGERADSLDRIAGLLLGADDYVVKPFDPEELVARVRAVLRRAAPVAAVDPGGLTPRELQVLRLLAGGRDQQQIAAELVISPRTVGTHIERILHKLGVHSRAQAIAHAYRANLALPVG